VIGDRMNPGSDPNKISDTTPKHRNDSILMKIVLRNYAANLRRSWRNSPRAAFVDATFQVEALIAVIVACMFGIINLLLSRTIVPSLARGAHGRNNGVVLLTVLGLIVMVSVDRTLKRYEPDPGVQVAYDTPRDRRLVYCYYAIGFAVIGLTLMGAYYINLALPAS
jgi:hypothetical protein